MPDTSLKITEFRNLYSPAVVSKLRAINRLAGVLIDELTDFDLFLRYHVKSYRDEYLSEIIEVLYSGEFTSNILICTENRNLRYVSYEFALKYIDLSILVTDLGYLFRRCNFTELNLENFNTKNVVSMEGLFYESRTLKTVKLSNFNTSKVKSMKCMFYSCESLETLDIASFDTSNVKSMYRMFAYCENLKELDISNFNTENVETMKQMFAECTKLRALDLLNFNTSRVSTMQEMFAYCTNLKNLDISNFVVNIHTAVNAMFAYCTNLESVRLSESLKGRGTQSPIVMFRGCTATLLSHITESNHS